MFFSDLKDRLAEALANGEWESDAGVRAADMEWASVNKERTADYNMWRIFKVRRVHL